MDQAAIGPIITALAVLVTALTALIAVLRQGPKLDTIKEQTNSTLTHLQARADTATDQQATAAELAARPSLPPPTQLPNRIHP